MPKFVIWVVLLAVSVTTLPALSDKIFDQQRGGIIVSADTPSKARALEILAPVY